MRRLTDSRLMQDNPILIVDDDQPSIEALRRILRGAGHSGVIGTTDPLGLEALLAEHHPGLIVLDLHMPRMDGFAVLEQIRTRYPPGTAPAVLVITASDSREERLQALASGAGDFLCKPYDPDEVRLRVANLLESHSKRRLFSSFLDCTHAAMIGQDAAGRCAYVNRSALDLLGYASAESLIGQDAHALLHHSRPDGTPLPGSECPICMARERGGTVQRDEDVLWRADGTPLPVEYSAFPLDAASQPDGILVTFVDRRPRLASERSQRLATTVFESVNRALMITDAQADIVSVNPAYTTLTGWSEEEVLGRNPRFRQSGRHEADFYREMWEALLDEDGWEGEIWNLRKDGHCYLEEITITTVRDERAAITHYVAAIRDLTQRRHEGEVLERARHQAEAANQAKSHFVASLSHEIRTPLTAILGFAETLAETERSPAVDTIIRNARYLRELVNDVLDFSKIEAGRLEIERIEVGLAELLRGLAALGAAQAQVKGLAFEVIVEPPWPRTLVTDPTRVKQILTNLLGNAIKFTERGSVSLRVGLDREREQLVCAVEDTGIGIAANRLDTIFDAFTQAEAATTRTHGGSGLGLSIAKALAQRLGGDLSVQSTPGRGSVFTATLATGPVPDERLEHAAPNLSPALPPSDTAASAPPRLAGRVLLAEDYPDTRALIRHHIETAGAHATLAENGRQALELAQQQAFDLILMDMRMPVMDGLEATRLLRLIGVEAPIVMLTANATPEDREEARAAGCDDFLTKPIEQGAFFAALARSLPPAPADAPTPPSGNPPRLEALRERFLQGLPGEMDALWQAATEGNFETIAKRAHQLKGIGGSFGMPEVTQVAGTLEQQARLRDEVAVVGLLYELESLCQQPPS